MPDPWSRTRTATRRASSAQLTSMALPSGEYFAALSLDRLVLTLLTEGHAAERGIQVPAWRNGGSR
jgi:hypothetical protein